MSTTARPTLDDYLALEYRLDVIPDPDGGYTVEYPDLPGCMSDIETLEELPAVAEEIRRLWLATAYDHGMEIPLPSYPEEYSGKFNLRLPKSLHRRLAEAAARDEVSLNQHVVGLLSEGIGGGEVLVALRGLLGTHDQLCADVATLATQVAEMRSQLTTYSVERGAAPKQRQTAGRPSNVVLFGAVAA